MEKKKKWKRTDVHTFSVEVARAHINLDLVKILENQELEIHREDLRFLVDLYYQFQEMRKRLDNQTRSLPAHESTSATVLPYFAYGIEELEKSVVGAMRRFIYGTERTEGDATCQWAVGQKGVDVIIAAGIKAYVDIHQTPTRSALMRFAGYDPTCEWLGRDRSKELLNEVMGKEKIVTDEHFAEVSTRTNRSPERLLTLCRMHGTKGGPPNTGPVTRDILQAVLAKRPWNKRLKSICWNMGECFKRLGDRGGPYTDIYRTQKIIEIQRNEKGENLETAERDIKHFSKKTEAYRWYKQGKLPPGRLDLRAMRVAVKRFLSHWWEVEYKNEYGKEPPEPYIIAHDERHTHWRKAQG
jgi:hypothetical protein